MKSEIKVSAALEKKLKKSDPEIRRFVSALNSEILKLQKRITKLEVELVSAQSRIKALEERKDNLASTVYAALNKESHVKKANK